VIRKENGETRRFKFGDERKNKRRNKEETKRRNEKNVAQIILGDLNEIRITAHSTEKISKPKFQNF
jgi:hypothetical protein